MYEKNLNDKMDFDKLRHLFITFLEYKWDKNVWLQQKKNVPFNNKKQHDLKMFLHQIGMQSIKLLNASYSLSYYLIKHIQR